VVDVKHITAADCHGSLMCGVSMSVQGKEPGVVLGCRCVLAVGAGCAGRRPTNRGATARMPGVVAVPLLNARAEFVERLRLDPQAPDTGPLVVSMRDLQHRAIGLDLRMANATAGVVHG
jgi:hypothetical protein